VISKVDLDFRVEVGALEVLDLWLHLVAGKKAGKELVTQ
jgi:hypothetical protein